MLSPVSNRRSLDHQVRLAVALIALIATVSLALLGTLYAIAFRPLPARAARSCSARIYHESSIEAHPRPPAGSVGMVHPIAGRRGAATPRVREQNPSRMPAVPRDAGGCLRRG